MTIEPKKILLIHNNPEERVQLGVMLSHFGHEVRFSCPLMLNIVVCDYFVEVANGRTLPVAGN
jgi:hypothetical protein